MTTSTMSIIAYRAFAPKDIGKRQSAVLSFLLNHGPLSNKDLANKMLLPINTITPRVKELRDLGLVELDHIQLDNHTNRPEQVWRVRDIGLRGD